MTPQLHIIAGPNGAGKTTFATEFLPCFTSSLEFVNADVIAQELSPSAPESVAFRAGRQMLERIDTLAKQRKDFSLETTLAGKSYVPWLRELKRQGYLIRLYFLWLPETEMSVARVADRVRKGGHNIQDDIIRRRYQAGIKNLFKVYRPLLDSWILFDNSMQTPYPIAREARARLTVLDERLFRKCFDMAIEPTDETLQETAETADWINALIALRLAKRGVIEEHLKTGDPLIIWRDGKVYRQPPDEAKREFEESLRNDPWAHLIPPKWRLV